MSTHKLSEFVNPFSAIDSPDRAPFVFKIVGYVKVKLPGAWKLPDHIATQKSSSARVTLKMAPICALLDTFDYDGALRQLIDCLDRVLHEDALLNRGESSNLQNYGAKDIAIKSLAVKWNTFGNVTVISENNWHEVAMAVQKRGLVDRLSIEILVGMSEESDWVDCHGRMVHGYPEYYRYEFRL